MHLLSLLLVAVLPVASMARMHVHRNSQTHRSRHHNHSRSTVYKLQDKFQGQTFFDGWDFFTQSDPTHGNVIYESKENAQDLAYVQPDGTAVLKVDNVSTVAPGGNRRSVRITSKASYNGALVIADFWRFAHGPTVWPAFWAVGPNWPNGGEIDIVEFVNEYTTNQNTLHTGTNGVCTSNPNVGPLYKSANGTATQSFTGNLVSTQCLSSGSNNNGCAFTDGEGSAGHPFNVAAGGVFATLWDDTQISIWRFERNQIPQDIQNGNPNPDSWGTPVALWSNDSCNIAASFQDLSLVINISICGDWAGADFNNGNNGGTCADAVANSTNYDWAQINVNYISVYQAA
jgi:hypothetical protein